MLLEGCTLNLTLSELLSRSDSPSRHSLYRNIVSSRHLLVGISRVLVGIEVVEEKIGVLMVLTQVVDYFMLFVNFDPDASILCRVQVLSLIKVFPL